MKIAIMQPTFLPWCGYFALIDSVDLFVFLDHVAFNSRSWQQRNRIKTADGQQWITVPVHSTRGDAINEVKIAGNLDKIIGSIKHNCNVDEVVNIIRQNHTHIAELNISLILKLMEMLGINTPTKRSSAMKARGHKSDLLANICREVGATEYISAPGSSDYLDPSVFDCGVSYFNFTHPVYKQKYGEFIPYMSVVDLLHNEGKNSMNIIRNALSSHPG